MVTSYKCVPLHLLWLFLFQDKTTECPRTSQFVSCLCVCDGWGTSGGIGQRQCLLYCTYDYVYDVGSEQQEIYTGCIERLVEG